METYRGLITESGSCKFLYTGDGDENVSLKSGVVYHVGALEDPCTEPFTLTFEDDGTDPWKAGKAVKSVHDGTIVLITEPGNNLFSGVKISVKGMSDFGWRSASWSKRAFNPFYGEVHFGIEAKQDVTTTVEEARKVKKEEMITLPCNQISVSTLKQIIAEHEGESCEKK